MTTIAIPPIVTNAPSAPANGKHIELEAQAFAFDKVPGQELPPPPLFLTVWARGGLGKTHIGCTFPGPVLVVDTDNRADWVVRQFRNTYWKRVATWADVLAAIGAFVTRESSGTVLFDSASDLNAFAEAHWIAELNEEARKAGKEKAPRIHPQLHWTEPYRMISEVGKKLRGRGYNVVFTARETDEYAGKGEDREKTGRGTVSSFIEGKICFASDFVVQLMMKDGARIGIVSKNGAKKPGTYRRELRDEELTFAGIAAEMNAAAIKLEKSASAIQPAAPTPEPAPHAAPAAAAPPVEAPKASAIVATNGVTMAEARERASAADLDAMKAAALEKGKAIVAASPALSPTHEAIAQTGDVLPASAAEISDLEAVGFAKWGISADDLWKKLVAKGYAKGPRQILIGNRNKVLALLSGGTSTTTPAPAQAASAA